MRIEEAEELAGELDEFGYRETDDPDEADRRRYYKVEKWDAGEQHVVELIHASNDLTGPEQSSPPRRSAGRAAAIRCARTSARSSAGRPIAISAWRPTSHRQAAHAR
jgi:hypothetical protein